MGIEYLLTDPIQTLRDKLKQDFEEGICGYGIFSKSVVIEDGVFRFHYPIIPGMECPFRHFYNGNTLLVQYDIDSGSVFGSAPGEIEIPILDETEKILIEYLNLNRIDGRSGKPIKDLSAEEFLERFFPKLDLERPEEN